MFHKKRDDDADQGRAGESAALRRRQREEELHSSISEPPPEPEAGTVLILERMKRGDRAAGDELALRYRERLERFVQLKMGNLRGLAAEDIVQDAYIKLFQGLERFEYRGKDSVYAYLMRVAVNLIISQQRRPSNKPAVSGEEADDLFTRLVKEQPSPVSVAGQSELRRILDETMQLLPEDQRHALLYRVVLGIPSKLAAQYMGLADAAAFDHLASRSKMALLKLAEPRLKEWRERG
jgi:RNA polymerase sigma-70 factor (ECF subfamily)